MKIDLKVLNQYKSDGWLINQKHPDLPLTIWNYSVNTTFAGHWDDITLQCRSLVVDDEGNIVGRPFPKFFNIEENRHIPHEEFDIYNKLDGSLILVFNHNKQWVVASRGSFTSEHAIKARELFVKTKFEVLPVDRTYCFELIAPFNRVVVNYDGAEKLIMTGCFSNVTDTEYDIHNTYFGEHYELVKKYEGLDWRNVKTLNWKNSEGFVVRFANGSRCKIKFEDYIRLHRIMTNISEKNIFKALMDKVPITSLLEDVPDEFFNEIKEIEGKYYAMFLEIEMECLGIYAQLKNENFETRKEFAVQILKQKYPQVLFNMLDGINYDRTIWNIIFNKEFKNNNK